MMTRTAAIAALVLAASPAEAQTVSDCRFPTVDFGRMYAGAAAGGDLAEIGGGTITIGSARRVQAQITGCAPNGAYSLRLPSQGRVRIANSGVAIEGVLIVTAVNGSPLPQPLDLRTAPLNFIGNPRLELVLAVDNRSLKLTPGGYSGPFLVEFSDR